MQYAVHFRGNQGLLSLLLRLILFQVHPLQVVTILIILLTAEANTVPIRLPVLAAFAIVLQEVFSYYQVARAVIFVWTFPPARAVLQLPIFMSSSAQRHSPRLTLANWSVLNGYSVHTRVLG